MPIRPPSRRRWLLPALVGWAALALIATAAPSAGAVAAASAPAAATTASRALPGPLHTFGRWIVDRRGVRVKLTGANWSGAETGAYVVGGLDLQPLDSLAARIAGAGFNTVRLPWSNELVERNPVVPARFLTANPQLEGRRALSVLDAVITALGRHGVMVVLDNHRSRADWCCDEEHGDGLWYTRQYSQASWIADWTTMARRYRSTANVIAAELRNEIRPEPQLAPGPTDPTWGDGNRRTDWRLAAMRGGDAVLRVAPNLLIMVGGINYSTDLTGIRHAPAHLSMPHRLVYVAHDYRWDYATDVLANYSRFARSASQRWGYIVHASKAVRAPVYVSETGTCTNPNPTEQCDPMDPTYFADITRYLRERELDYAYWPFNGTQGVGYNRTYGVAETYGLLSPDWAGYGDRHVLRVLQSLQTPRRGPGIDRPRAPHSSLDAST